MTAQRRPDKLPTATPLVAGLGEALFDCFGDREVLGGAPVNFAVHAHQLLSPSGGAAMPLSRIGDDDLGRRLLGELQQRGLSTAAIQVDEQAPTGVVTVEVDAAGQPSYDIRQGAAWDGLEFTPQAAELAARCSAVCFGTLAQRDPRSRAAIRKFLEGAKGALKLCDLNLRPPHYDRQVIESSLCLATVLKLSDEELREVSGMLSIGNAAAAPEDQARALCREYSLDALILTRGARGTVIFQGDRCVEGEPVKLPRDDDADSVGAGDACGAAACCALLLGWSLEETVDSANFAGAFVASRRGATPTLPADLIRRFTAS